MTGRDEPADRPCPAPIEDYAMLGDMRTAALVSSAGSLDWLCLPRFDSEACFAALLGTPENGRWLLGTVEPATTTRSYEAGTLVLRAEHETADGRVAVEDFMPTTGDATHIVRRIVGLSGEVLMRHEWILRFGYGDARPWIHRIPDHSDLGSDEMLVATAGPNAVGLRGPRLPHPHGLSHVDEFAVREGEVATFVMSWWPSHLPPPPPFDVARARATTLANYHAWTTHARYRGRYAEAVRTSLAVLRGLTDRDTGGIVAAATMGLPEQLGGPRNWDYRYCWLRDASLTLEAFLTCGYRHEAATWRDWLLRAVAGDPSRMQIMYGVDGRRDLTERVLDHLPGYAGSRPVLLGNAASDQRQLDVLGEVMAALQMAREHGLAESEDSWALQVALVDHLADTWDRPDNGLWEIRGPARRFTHSRAMVWVALDRAIRGVETHGLEASVERWREVRDAVREDVLTRGVAPDGHFRQHDETDEVDASLLLLATTGFVEADDPRYIKTVERIERDLLRDGFVLRYRTASGVDGLAGDESPFLACSFWLVRAYALLGRRDDAFALMDRLVGLRNEVGLLSEEYDPKARRFLGNMPQAFSHLALIDAAVELAGRPERTDPVLR
ncbi:glycoside hydrolase family 15 protein [Mobilicoccus massiliensis]|uniref:glycoside hydrolase family 15 protein n=1 Tax=Mobilicoccus massiliensis TaxID=1522310 RepID=UPI000A921798|nr:glycoside hydrolase family 15 protein [Mobilicoccus massiliensis]